MEFISIHVPKTAGSAFKTGLQSVYPGEALLLDYNDFIGRRDSCFRTDFEGWRRDHEEYLRKLPASVRAVHGHFWAGKYLPYFPDAMKVVWLREPAHLLISAYHYWKAAPFRGNPLQQLLRDENLTVLEFAALPDLRNSVSRTFLRDFGVADFDFVGIQECFDDDMRALCRLMNWPIIDVPIVNKTRSGDYNDYKFEQGTIDRIRELNVADVELYEQALRCREKRIG